jgi:hypothetical protein
MEGVKLTGAYYSGSVGVAKDDTGAHVDKFIYEE